MSSLHCDDAHRKTQVMGPWVEPWRKKLDFRRDHSCFTRGGRANVAAMSNSKSASQNADQAGRMNDPALVTPDFAVINGTLLLPDPAAPAYVGNHRYRPTVGGILQVKTSVAIKNGKIIAIGDRAHEGALEIFDAKGLHVLPGVIDSQVHFREPGLTHKEDLESGTRGAVLGGVTTVFEMPNTKPPTSNRAEFEQKLMLTRGRIWSDLSFFIGDTPDNSVELRELEKHPNCCAVKIFMGSSTGSLLVAEDEPLLTILKTGKYRVAVHCEDEFRLNERKHIVEGHNDVCLHPVWRDEITALRATQRIVRLAEISGRPVHVLHVTTEEEMDFLKNKKDIVTVETTPQHLTLSAPECYERLGTLAQMNPPIRAEHHRAALWRAVNNGVVDVIGSDHAPHTLKEKSNAYPNTPSGMTGVQTLLPLMLTHCNQGRLSLERLVEICCRNPARLYNAIGKGEIRVGNDADFTIVDMGKQKKIETKWIASKSGWTPFEGFNSHGWPISTIVRGNIVMREDQLLGTPIGAPVHFQKY